MEVEADGDHVVVAHDREILMWIESIIDQK
jgi:hypothetical protein